MDVNTIPTNKTKGLLIRPCFKVISIGLMTFVGESLVGDSSGGF